jgi:hypothetical protein
MQECGDKTDDQSAPQIHVAAAYNLRAIIRREAAAFDATLNNTDEIHQLILQHFIART